MTPCACRGTAAHIHPRCLERYIQYYPDRVCRVCLMSFYVPTTLYETLGAGAVFLFLNSLMFFSDDRIIIKVFMLVTIWLISRAYARAKLFTTPVLLTIFCLGGLFLSGGNFHAMTMMLIVLGALSMLHTMARFIPVLYILNFIAIVMLYCYVSMITVVTLTSVDKTTFTAYIILLFLVWNAVVNVAVGD